MVSKALCVLDDSCLPCLLLVVQPIVVDSPANSCIRRVEMTQHALHEPHTIHQFPDFSPNSLLLGVLNALKNGRLGVLDGLVGFPAGLSPTSFHLSPSSFHLSPSSFHLSPRLGACSRVPGWLVSHFLSFVSQAGCLWSGFRPACLPLPFICFLLLFCLWVPGRLVPHFLLFVSHFFSFVSHFFSFVSQAGCLWSGSRPACLPLPFIRLPVLFICLPGWVLVVGFPAGLSPTSFHLSPTSFHSFVSPPFSAGHAAFLFIWFPGLSLVLPFSAVSIHLSPMSVTANFRPFPLAMQHFYSFVPRACHWWCPPFSAVSIHLSPRSVTAGVRPFPLAM